MAEIIAVQGFAGTGKTTHSEYLHRQYTYNGAPIEHVSIGERLRAIRTGMEDSRYAEFLTGSKVPPLTDELITNVVFERIDQISDGLVLMDGYPREASGVTTLVEAMRQGNHELLGSVWLKIWRSTSVERLQGRGKREGEVLELSSLREEAERRYIRDSIRMKAAMESLGRIAGVQTINVNVGIKEARKRFIGAVGRLGVVLDGAVLLPE